MTVLNTIETLTMIHQICDFERAIFIFTQWLIFGPVSDLSRTIVVINGNIIYLYYIQQNSRGTIMAYHITKYSIGNTYYIKAMILMILIYNITYVCGNVL